MFTVESFIQKFEKYSDEELFEIHANIDGYSDEAKTALSDVLEEKGGLDALITRMNKKQELANEQKNIEKEVRELGASGFDIDFIKKSISSVIIPEPEIFDIINDQYKLLQLDLADKAVTSKTVGRSIVGGIFASLIGGVLWGLQMIFSNAIFFIFGIGLVLLCYGIIKLFTRQSKQNNAVFLSTLISVILALLLGQLLYEIVGFKG